MHHDTTTHEEEREAHEAEDAPVHTQNDLLLNALRQGLRNTIDLCVFFAIDPDNGTRPADLREAIGICPGTVSMVADRLMALKLITRTGSTRGCTYHYSDHGRHVRAWIEDGTPLPN